MPYCASYLELTRSILFTKHAYPVFVLLPPWYPTSCLSASLVSKHSDIFRFVFSTVTRPCTSFPQYNVPYDIHIHSTLKKSKIEKSDFSLWPNHDWLSHLIISDYKHNCRLTLLLWTDRLTSAQTIEKLQPDDLLYHPDLSLIIRSSDRFQSSKSNINLMCISWITKQNMYIQSLYNIIRPTLFVNFWVSSLYFISFLQPITILSICMQH